MATKLLDLPKLINYTAGAEPLWGEDAGRDNMTGTFSGTFNGYYMNVDLTFGRCTQGELYQIKQALQKPIFELEIPDPDASENGQTYVEEFYGTVINPTRNNVDGLYEQFTVSLVATTKNITSDFS